MTFPFPIIAPVLSVTAVDFVTSVTRTNSEGTLLMPSGIQAGDIIVVFQKYGGYDNLGSPANYDGTNDNGTGFTKIGGIYQGPAPYYSGCIAASYKIAVANDDGNTIGGFMSYNTADRYNHNSAAIYVYRPNYDVTLVSAVDVFTGEQRGGSIATTVNASQSALACIAFGFAGTPNTAALSWGAGSDQNSVVNNGYADIEVDVYGFNKGAGADVSVSSSDSGQHFLLSGYLEVS